MRTTVLSRGCWGIFSFCLLLLVGCDGSDSGGDPISSQPLSGKIGGKAWTFATGETNAFLSEGEDTFFTELYASTFAACDTWGPDNSAGSIIVLLPRETGSFSLGMSMNVTFYVPPGDNWIATKGSLEITEVTDTSITGGLKASYNSDNTAEGRFTASICP